MRSEEEIRKEYNNFEVSPEACAYNVKEYFFDKGYKKALEWVLNEQKGI